MNVNFPTAISVIQKGCSRWSRCLCVVVLCAVWFGEAGAENFLYWDADSGTVIVDGQQASCLSMVGGSVFDTNEKYDGVASIRHELGDLQEDQGCDVSRQAFGGDIIGGKEIYLRWWMKIDSNMDWGSNARLAKIARFTRPNERNPLYGTIHMHANGFEWESSFGQFGSAINLFLDVDVDPRGGCNGSALVGDLGAECTEWREYIYYVKQNSCLSCRDGVAALYVNGALAAEQTKVTFAGYRPADGVMTFNYAWVGIGGKIFPQICPNNANCNVGGTIWIDEISIDDTWNSRVNEPVVLSPPTPVPVAGECADWQSREPNWIWCDGFEADSSLEERYEDVSLVGMSQVVGEAFEGQGSLRQTYTQGQVDAGWVAKVKDDSFADHIFFRWYHKFSPGYTRFPPKMARAGYRERFGNWETIFQVHSWLDEQNGRLTADVLAKNSSQTSSEWLPIRNANYSFANSLGEWVATEVEIKLNTPGLSDGVYRMWINDVLEIDVTNVDLRGVTSDRINEVMLDTYWNGGATASLTRHFDNFVISTRKIGTRGAEVSRRIPMSPTGLKIE